MSASQVWIDIAGEIAKSYVPDVTPLLALTRLLGGWTTLRIRHELRRNGRWVTHSWHSTNPEIKAACGEQYEPVKKFEWIEKDGQ